MIFENERYDISSIEHNDRNAILYGVFPKKFAAWLLYFSLLTVSYFAFFLPSDFGQSDFDWLIKFALNIPDVQYTASKSLFPFAAAAVYSFALLASFFLAVIACFIKSDVGIYRRIHEEQSITTRVILFIFFLLLMLTPYLGPLEITQYQRSYAFFKLVWKGRFFLMVYGCAVIICGLAIWVSIFYEFVNFLRWILRSKS